MTNHLERVQRLDGGPKPLEMLEISAPSFSSVLRIVNDTQDWTSNGNLYRGYPFRFKGAADQPGQSPRAELEIVNEGRGLTQDLEGRPPNEEVKIRYLLAHPATPDTIISRSILPMTQVRAAGAVVTAQAGNDYRYRQQAVKLRGTPYLLPGIH